MLVVQLCLFLCKDLDGETGNALKSFVYIRRKEIVMSTWFFHCGEDLLWKLEMYIVEIAQTFASFKYHAILFSKMPKYDGYIVSIT